MSYIIEHIAKLLRSRKHNLMATGYKDSVLLKDFFQKKYSDII